MNISGILMHLDVCCFNVSQLTQTAPTCSAQSSCVGAVLLPRSVAELLSTSHHVK